MKRLVNQYKEVGLLLTVLLLFICLDGQAVFAQKEAKVLMVKSKNIDSYNLAVEGFRKRAPTKWDISECDLGGSIKNAGKMLNRLEKEEPDLVVAVGAKALVALGRSKISYPVVFCMVMNPEACDLQTTNTTGVSLIISPEEQMKVLVSLSPKIKRIGVLLRKHGHSHLFGDVAVLAEKHGVEVTAVEIGSVKDIPRKLRAVLGKVDALWMLDDCYIHSKETLDFVVLKCIENELAFMAISKVFVKEGALVSLSPSFFSNGEQACEMAERILTEGKMPEDIPMSFHKNPELVINLKIARKIGLAVSPEFLDKAKRIYE